MIPAIFRLPFPGTQKPLFIARPAFKIKRGENVQKPLQIILWVSLGSRDASRPDDRAFRFPVVLDTGFNGSLCITVDQLTRWTGYDRRYLDGLFGNIHRPERFENYVNATLWLHANVPFRSALSPCRRAAQIPLRAPQITDDVHPRLPLLGARALDDAGVKVLVNYKRRYVTIWRSWFS